MDPENTSCSWQVGYGCVTKVLFSSLNVAHGEVDGEDDGDTDHGDDEHEDQEMSLEPDVLQSIYATSSENHII